ncbi:MAG: hypothetical protein ACKO2P_16595, partial [Planctomycetota bacterium]
MLPPTKKSFWGQSLQPPVTARLGCSGTSPTLLWCRQQGQSLHGPPGTRESRQGLVWGMPRGFLFLPFVADGGIGSLALVLLAVSEQTGTVPAASGGVETGVFRHFADAALVSPAGTVPARAAWNAGVA